MSDHNNRIVYLVASGPTAWQGAGRVQGNTDLPLSEGAREDLDSALAGWRPEGEVRTVYTAPDEASRQTAAVLAERLGASRVKAVDEVAEMNLGLWQGLTEPELCERYRKVFGRWRSDPSAVSVPHGEALAVVSARVAAALRKLILRSGNRPLVLVLRPVVLKLCAAWLGGEEVGPGVSLNGAPPPAVQRFDADRQAWRACRAVGSGHARNGKGVSA